MSSNSNHETCSNASAQSAVGYWHMGSLVLLIEGSKSTPCHKVRVDRSLLSMEPPAFILNQCAADGIKCIQRITPFEDLFGPFAIGPYRPVVKLAHAGGVLEVKVEPIFELAKALKPLGGEVPVPFFTIPKDASGKKNGGKDIQLPFFTSSVGEPFVAGGLVDRAIGYGETIEDAFDQAAAAVLAGRRERYPDQISAVKIVESGALWGGFVGYVGTRYVIAELVK